MDVLDMFPDRVLPEPNSGCWLWTGAIESGRSGYPVLIRRGKRIPVHRLSYSVSNGAIGGLMVLHKCDAKTCVNPDHLELGDNRKNIRDAYERGLARARYGEECIFSKLSKAQVDEIRSVQGRMKRGQQSEMAARFGVATSTIRHIRTGRNWGKV